MTTIGGKSAVAVVVVADSVVLVVEKESNLKMMQSSWLLPLVVPSIVVGR